jgi:hypothetical protein
LAPRIALRVTETPMSDGTRLAGEGTVSQIVADLTELEQLGASTTVLDPFNGDLDVTRHPETAWHALATVAAAYRRSRND